MNRQTIRIVAGVNLVAGCLLLQGCGMFGKKTADQNAATIPEENVVPATTQTVEQVESVPLASEMPMVQNTSSYTIQKGDTLSAVAYKFNLRWQDVVAVNPGISPNKLRVGQVIQLPGMVDVSKARNTPYVSHKKASAPKTSAPKSSFSAVSGSMTSYVVKSGDSLSLIAHKHGVKTAALREANGLKGDKLLVGQKLKVPGATKKVSESAPTSKKTSATAAKTTAPKSAKATAKKTEEKVAAPAAVTPPPVVEPTTAAPAVAPAATVGTSSAASAPAAAESTTQTYTVKEGEDLYAVAIRWGVSPSDLKSLNNLTSTELKAGTVLKIPGAQ